MLSTERSIDPPSSPLNQIEVKSDDKNSAQRIGSQKLDTLDCVVSPPTPNFSIRDHVYKSRSNGIGACWPFKPKFLQLCIKNGVKELLPPFEPSHLIKGCTNSVIAQSDPTITDVLHERRELNSKDNVSRVTDNLQSEIIKHKKKRNKGFRKVKSSSELPEKKCKLVVKLSCLVPGTSRAEELASNNSAAIDQMASKICPVCRTFSSSSNTTLNAHIDQCLSMGSSTKQLEFDVLKPRIKPRKKKLMVDIYTTALNYTLEDLDKRNGTNWAASMAMADPGESRTEHVNTKLKEPENLSEVMVKSRGKDREGAVYVDSNGIKIRILSRDSPLSVVSREEMKKGKVPFGKRKGIGMKKMEKKKLMLDKKKSKKFKILKTQVRQLTADGDRSGMGYENKNRVANSHLNQPVETSKGPVILNGTVSPLGNWVCAKRTDIHKKRKDKSPFKITQSLASIIEDCPSVNTQVPKYSNSKFTSSKLGLKLPKPLVGNGKSRCEALPENASTNTSASNNPSVEPQNGLALSKKFRKQRSMLKSGKRGGQVPNSSRVFYESTGVLAGETIHESKRLKFTPNGGLHEEFAPEPEQFRENTKVQNATSPPEDTELDLDVEALASKEHLNEHVDSPNDDPIHMESASWLQEMCAVGRRTDDCDDENDDAPEDDDDNEDHDDDNLSADADDDDYDDDIDDVAVETSDETGHETPQDDSSITSNGEDDMNLERSLANFRELSGSPSTASTMSLSTLNEPFTKQPSSFTQPVCPELMVRVAEKPQGGEEIMDKPCVCSCKESLPKERKKAPTGVKEMLLPPLYIGPRETGPFNAYRGFPRPDPVASIGYESPSQSFSMLSQSPVPPSPNPVLRLMGKNLLVVNHEEITVQPPTPSSHSSSGFASPNCGANQNFSYQNFSSVFSQSQPAANMYQPTLVSDRQRAVSPSPYVPKEVIVIDDPPKIDNMPLPVPVPMQLHGVSMVGGNPAPRSISMLGATMMQHSPFFCFPQHNHAGQAGPFLYPSVGTGYITQQVGPSGSHELGSFVPSSFAFRSPSSHVGNPLFYSHTMR